MDAHVIQNCHYPGATSSCEKTGCGAFNTDWYQSTSDHFSTNGSSNSSKRETTECIDNACINTPDRDHDRLVWMTHTEVDYYDDYVKIGDKVHTQTLD